MKLNQNLMKELDEKYCLRCINCGDNTNIECYHCRNIYNEEHNAVNFKKVG